MMFRTHRGQAVPSSIHLELTDFPVWSTNSSCHMTIASAGSPALRGKIPPLWKELAQNGPFVKGLYRPVKKCRGTLWTDRQRNQDRRLWEGQGLADREEA